MFSCAPVVGVHNIWGLPFSSIPPGVWSIFQQMDAWLYIPSLKVHIYLSSFFDYFWRRWLWNFRLIYTAQSTTIPELVGQLGLFPLDILVKATHWGFFFFISLVCRTPVKQDRFLLTMKSENILIKSTKRSILFNRLYISHLIRLGLNQMYNSWHMLRNRRV
jgi:hypothetical protein